MYMYDLFESFRFRSIAQPFFLEHLYDRALHSMVSLHKAKDKILDKG